MARTRLEKTLADYIVIAISPVLIMLLVGSLVFFLLQASYRGQFESRLHWIMFWYVFAAVLVARIAIEEGKEHARMFGIVMGAVAAIAVWRFVDSAWLGWLMLGVVWWCSSKLTWDCTMIDDSEDASGEGLLEVAGLNGTQPVEPPKQQKPIEPPEEKPKKKKKRKGKKSKSKKDQESSSEQVATPTVLDESDAANSNQKTHSPGLWVVYFSLAALPLFGIGQLLIPMAEADRRTYAFQLLAVYVASAMALLLTTSFLGLRRYLRQRKLEMPASITRGWLGVGAFLLAGLMLAALLIPRPQSDYSLTGLIDKIDAKARQASNWAILKSDRAEGQGRRIGDQDAKSDQKGEGDGKPVPRDQKANDNKQSGGEKTGNAAEGKPGEQSSQNGKQSGDKSGGEQQRKDASGQADKKGDQSQKSDAGEKKNKDSTSDQANQKQNADTNRNQNQPQQAEAKKDSDPNRDPNAQNKPPQNDPVKPNPSTPSNSTLSKLLSSVGGPVKWILYGILALVGLYLLMRHWNWIVDFCARLWAEFLSLFGRRTEPEKNKSGDGSGQPVKPIRPFASYENPFFSGAADRMSSRELVRYTFEALEAWSRENSIERAPQQTVLEFAEAIGEQEPQLAKNVNQTALLYVRVAYAAKSPVKDRLDVLEKLWQQLKT